MQVLAEVGPRLPQPAPAVQQGVLKVQPCLQVVLLWVVVAVLCCLLGWVPVAGLYCVLAALCHCPAAVR